MHDDQTPHPVGRGGSGIGAFVEPANALDVAQADPELDEEVEAEDGEMVGQGQGSRETPMVSAGRGGLPYIPLNAKVRGIPLSPSVKGGLPQTALSP